MINVGDLVVALRDGGHDRDGLPVERPVKGKVYRITGIYEMPYGLGCTLEGMNPAPYRGYFLFRHNKDGKSATRYFEKVESADKEFTAMMRNLIKRKEPVG